MERISREQTLALINNLIENNREAIIEAVRHSGVKTTNSITNDALYALILSELENGNGYLAFHLTREFGNEKKSNLAPGMGEAVAGVSNFLSGLVGLIGKGKDRRATLQMSKTQYKMAQMEYKARLGEQRLALEQMRMKQARAKERSESKKQTITMVLIIGGIVLVGATVVTILVVSKKKRLAKAA